MGVVLQKSFLITQKAGQGTKRIIDKVVDATRQGRDRLTLAVGIERDGRHRDDATDTSVVPLDS
jgi:hypothetical protein